MVKRRQEPEVFDTPTEDFDVTIDINKLEKEWLNQPKLFFYWAERLAEARFEEDAAKQKLELVEAQLDASIRENSEEYDLIKVTDKAVEACLTRQATYQNALTGLNKAKRTTNILQAAVTALDQRKRALESLVALHGQNYFSTPRTRGEAAEAGAREIKERSVPGTRQKRG